MRFLEKTVRGRCLFAFLSQMQLLFEDGACSSKYGMWVINLAPDSEP